MRGARDFVRGCRVRCRSARCGRSDERVHRYVPGSAGSTRIAPKIANATTKPGADAAWGRTGFGKRRRQGSPTPGASRNTGSGAALCRSEIRSPTLRDGDLDRRLRGRIRRKPGPRPRRRGARRSDRSSSDRQNQDSPSRPATRRDAPRCRCGIPWHIESDAGQRSLPVATARVSSPTVVAVRNTRRPDGKSALSRVRRRLRRGEQRYDGDQRSET